MRIHFIVNPAASGGRAGEAWAALARTIQFQAIQCEQSVTACQADAVRLAEQVAEHYQMLVAVGGDGTANEVANGILRSKSKSGQTSLAVLPLGTGNDLARALGVRNAQDSLRAIQAGRTRRMDVIRVESVVNGQPNVQFALGFAAVGITSEIVSRISPRLKRLLGQKLAYLAGLTRALLSYKAAPMRLTCDGEVFDGRFLLACASNSEFAGGGLKLAPGARVDDGLLNVNLVQHLGRWQALQELRLLRAGRHTTHPSVRYVTARRLKVEDPGERVAQRGALEVVSDGDVTGRTPATFEVVPNALSVVTL